MEAAISINEIYRRLIRKSRETGEMPRFWPLVQCPAADILEAMASSGSSVWPYACIAVNPFSPREVFEFAPGQVVVAQFPIGLAEGVGTNGRIDLPPGLRISGAPECGSYSIDEFASSLSNLPTAPTVIVLGPSKSDWSLEANCNRLLRFYPLFKNTISQLWNLSADSSDLLFGMSA